MSHIVKQELQNIRPNTWIRIYNGGNHLAKVVSINVAESKLTILYHNDDTDEWDITLTIPYDGYINSELDSPGCLAHPGCEVRDWGECEKYYGINHHGELDPDPVRRLAFAILKGEGWAIDVAQDVLVRGG